MKAVSALCVLAFTLAVNAHFQLAFPGPRGPFVEDDEPGFCDGFTEVTQNRTKFPMSGGFFTWNSEHPKWSAAFYLSTDPNPDKFNKFTQVNSFFKASGEGMFCIPLDLSASNATGLHDGQNVTIQVLFDGGDGELFQCADLTLTSDASSISSVPCQNSTGSNSEPSSTTSATTPTSTMGSGATTPTSAMGSGALSLNLDLTLLLGVLGFASLIPLMA